jgi:hypothetical protein
MILHVTLFSPCNSVPPRNSVVPFLMFHVEQLIVLQQPGFEYFKVGFH